MKYVLLEANLRNNFCQVCTSTSLLSCNAKWGCNQPNEDWVIGCLSSENDDPEKQT